MIHQMRYDDCEMRNNGDGVKPIYQQREQLNKLALQNLKKGIEGKLGRLSNLQTFNFLIQDITTGTNDNFKINYNTSSTFPANATQTIMFGVSGTSGKALYYNIVSMNARFVTAAANLARVFQPTYISFYFLQNSNTSTTSLGTKIPQPNSLYGNGGGAVTYTTSGNIYGAQSISLDLVNDTPTYAQNNNLKGIRASGLALKSIYVLLSSSVDLSNVEIEVDVSVDLTSVSTSY